MCICSFGVTFIWCVFFFFSVMYFQVILYCWFNWISVHLLLCALISHGSHCWLVTCVLAISPCMFDCWYMIAYCHCLLFYFCVLLSLVLLVVNCMLLLVVCLYGVAYWALCVFFLLGFWGYCVRWSQGLARSSLYILWDRGKVSIHSWCGSNS